MHSILEQRRPLIVAIIAFLVPLYSAKAFGYGDPTEVLFSVARGRFWGDLNDGTTMPLYLIQSRKTPERTIHMLGDIVRTRVGIGIDLMYGESRVKQTSFPFAKEDTLFLKGIFLVPTACFFRQPQYRICFGLGNGTLNTNTASNRQDYGTWNYQIDGHFQVSEKLFVKAFGKYVGKVEQRIAGRDSAFALSMFGMSFGFVYF